MNHFNLPNALTCSRILAVPVIFLLWRSHQPLWAAGFAAIAAITDFFDGKLARQLKQETLFGAILDPVADKFFVLSLFGILAAYGCLPLWLFWLSLVRNVSQLISIPVLMGWKKIPFKVHPKMIPKVATALSFGIAIVGLAVGSPLPAYAIVVYVLLAALEIQILVTYWPRFYLILNRRHDTFE